MQFLIKLIFFADLEDVSLTDIYKLSNLLIFITSDIYVLAMKMLFLKQNEIKPFPQQRDWN